VATRAIALSRSYGLKGGFYPELAAAGPRTRILAVDPEIFVRTVTPDCMAYTCSFCADPKRAVLDACCSWGVDADAVERARIERRRAEIEPHLDRRSRRAEWFRKEKVTDDDFPSGTAWSARVVGAKCVFLRRGEGRRGCGLHATAVEGGESPYALKPLFCSLFPLTLEQGVLTHVHGDLDELSCSQEGPTLVEVAAPTLEALFGRDLVEELRQIRSAHAAER